MVELGGRFFILWGWTLVAGLSTRVMVLHGEKVIPPEMIMWGVGLVWLVCLARWLNSLFYPQGPQVVTMVGALGVILGVVLLFKSLEWGPVGGWMVVDLVDLEKVQTAVTYQVGVLPGGAEWLAGVSPYEWATTPPDQLVARAVTELTPPPLTPEEPHWDKDGKLLAGGVMVVIWAICVIWIG